MKKYYYAVKDKAEIYYIGIVYGRDDTTEEELIESTKEYARMKGYSELALVVWVEPKIGMVDLIYPETYSELKVDLLEEVMKIAL